MARSAPDWKLATVVIFTAVVSALLVAAAAGYLHF
jgi:hypothetical protein